MDFALPQIETTTLANEGVWMPLVQPGTALPVLDKDGKQVRIKLAGIDSTAYKKASRAGVIDRLNKTAKVVITDGELDKANDDTLRVLAACTIAWEGINTPEGQAIPCTEANAMKLYQAFPAVRDQVDRFIVERQHFLLSSKTA